MTKPALSIIVICLTFAGTTANADIISSGTYSVDVGGLPQPDNVPKVGAVSAGLTSLGAVTSDGTTLAALSFNFTDSRVTLGVNWGAPADPTFFIFPSPVEWRFTGLGLTGGSPIKGLSYNPAASTANIYAPVNVSSTANTLTIDTPTDNTLGTGGVYSYVFDIATVPEPSSFAILFAGGIGLYAKRRRRKKTAA